MIVRGTGCRASAESDIRRERGCLGGRGETRWICPYDACRKPFWLPLPAAAGLDSTERSGFDF